MHFWDSNEIETLGVEKKQKIESKGPDLLNVFEAWTNPEFKMQIRLCCCPPVSILIYSIYL